MAVLSEGCTALIDALRDLDPNRVDELLPQAYPLMRPSLDVQRVLAASEAQRWLALVKASRP